MGKIRTANERHAIAASRRQAKPVDVQDGPARPGKSASPGKVGQDRRAVAAA